MQYAEQLLKVKTDLFETSKAINSAIKVLKFEEAEVARLTAFSKVAFTYGRG
jgi:hypothetical protein